MTSSQEVRGLGLGFCQSVEETAAIPTGFQMKVKDEKAKVSPRVSFAVISISNPSRVHPGDRCHPKGPCKDRPSEQKCGNF